MGDEKRGEKEGKDWNSGSQPKHVIKHFTVDYDQRVVAIQPGIITLPPSDDTDGIKLEGIKSRDL